VPGLSAGASPVPGPECGQSSATRAAASRQTKETTWFVDSSVLLAALLGQSPATKAWFDQARANGDSFLGSRLLEVETKRFIANKELVKELQPGQIVVDRYLAKFELLTVDDALLDEAIAIQQPLRGADAIHVAAALRLGVTETTIVTHDAQRSKACRALGFTVLDPLTSDTPPGSAIATT
jgi:predicted nucleic acid-binding protein